MKFNINQKDLQESLSYCQNVIERRSTLPILSNVLIEAKSKKLTMPEYDSSFFIIPERSVPVTSQTEPEDAETLVVSRLTELSNLNRIGRVSLQREIRKQLRI